MENKQKLLLHQTAAGIDARHYTLHRVVNPDMRSHYPQVHLLNNRLSLGWKIWKTHLYMYYIFLFLLRRKYKNCRILKKLNRFFKYIFIYSKKFVISLLEHLDQATPTASTSKVGVITCKVSPSRLLQPIFSVSWYIPKLNRICDRYLKLTYT